MIKETQKRSICKAISWRLSGSIATVLVVYLFTRKISLSLGVGAVEFIAKMFFYYIHERVWARVHWGCISHPLSKISVKDNLTSEDLSIINDKLKELGYVD